MKDNTSVRAKFHTLYYFHTQSSLRYSVNILFSQQRNRDKSARCTLQLSKPGDSARTLSFSTSNQSMAQMDISMLAIFWFSSGLMWIVGKVSRVDGAAAGVRGGIWVQALRVREEDPSGNGICELVNRISCS